MRSSSLHVKYFFYVAFSPVLVLAFLSKVQHEKLTEVDKNFEEMVYKNKKSGEQGLKHLLIWTHPTRSPFANLGQDQQGFIDRKCPYTNCFVTSNKNYLDEEPTEFDVIAFNGPEVVDYTLSDLPSWRSPHQKFVFGSVESADYYPRCDNLLDGFFNWTWTYKLDSDMTWTDMVIRDFNKKVIGPNTIMHWMDLQDMDPISDELKLKLKSKSKAAAWLVSNCHTRSLRERFAEKLSHNLKKFNLSIDIYGKCGKLNCAYNNDCSKTIEEDYYFYLAFENSISEDYVTEKLIHAVLNNAVPVVFGGANYSRFLPNGSYLNARELGAEKLASTMNDLIENPDLYYEYFRWKNHYSYHRRNDNVETIHHCKICAMMNDERLIRKTTVYKKFKKWWTPPGRC